MTPKNLDIMLVGKYGKRKINSLTEMFANNQGVVTDKEGLADVVKEMYWDPWMKSYNALNLQYDPNSPYHIQRTLSQTDERDVSEVTDENVSSTATSSTETSSTTTDQASSTSSTDASVTDGGVDRVQTTNTSETDSTSTDSGSDTSATTGSTDVDATVTESGTDTVSGSVTSTTLSETKTNLPDEQMDLGLTHTVSSDDTTNTQTSDGVNDKSLAPYDSGTLKKVESNSSSVLTESSGDHTLSEVSVDKSIVEGNDSMAQTNSNSTNYGHVSTTDSSTDTSSSNTTTYGKVNTIDSETTDSGSSTTTYGKTETTDSDTTTSSTDTRTSSGEVGTTATSSDETDKTVTTNDDLSREITETETGNKWNSSTQELINQELELRRQNIYERILKDVVGLLTISIYTMEEA